jgi:hypothetical protein
VLASITKKGEIERELGLHLFPNWFWWLNCQTQVIELTSLLESISFTGAKGSQQANIKDQRWVQIKRAKYILMAPWSGAPDSVRCTRALDAELATFGKMGGRSAIIHRTVRCASGATATSRETIDCNAFNARLRAQRTEHAQLAHWTIYRTCPVHHRTA